MRSWSLRWTGIGCHTDTRETLNSKCSDRRDMRDFISLGVHEICIPSQRVSKMMSEVASKEAELSRWQMSSPEVTAVPPYSGSTCPPYTHPQARVQSTGRGSIPRPLTVQLPQHHCPAGPQGRNTAVINEDPRQKALHADKVASGMWRPPVRGTVCSASKLGSESPSMDRSSLALCVRVSFTASSHL